MYDSHAWLCIISAGEGKIALAKVRKCADEGMSPSLMRVSDLTY